jgi:glyoxylase-like metal-dependent hydrolase (beta-lactamase superfamily II)
MAPQPGGLQRRTVIVAAAAAVAPAALKAQASPPLSIGRFTSSERAYSTHSYWLEGPTGLVLVDTQFLPSDAHRFVDEAQRRTGKKAVLAIVLHPNPDKFNGTAVLQARGIRVITSAQVAALIPSVHRLRLSWFYEDYQPDYPKDAAQPEVFGERSTALQAAGLNLTLQVLGGVGCSGAHLVVQAGDAVFVGDLIASQGHAWLELAQFEPWLARLQELRALSPRRIYVGRGESAGPELIAAQADYLRRVRSIVLEAKPHGELGRFTRWRLKQQIVQAFPGYAWDGFVWEALPAIWQALAT